MAKPNTAILIIVLFSLALLLGAASVDDKAVSGDLSSGALTMKAWDALFTGEYEKANAYCDKCIILYKDEAAREQSLLKRFPDTGDVKNYETLNNVAACFFIKGEALFQQAGYEEAKPYYQAVIDTYGYAQYWDPKGWYWKVAEKSQAVLGKIAALQKPAANAKKEEVITKVEGYNFPLSSEGAEDIVDYRKYGEFCAAATAEYRYIIKDKKGLEKAAGEGIYPNNDVYKNPVYQEYFKNGLLDGSHWDYVNSDNLQANFYKWATAGEDPGVKLYYIAYALERAMHYKHAIKAYYALVVHYPKTVSWTYWKTPWYVGQVAIDKIKYLTRKHPELGMRLDGAKITVQNGFDFDITNDVIKVNPGAIVRCAPEELKIKRMDLSKENSVKKIGGPKVELVRYENGHWQLRVDGKPALVKALAYAPTVVGQSPDKGTLKDWTYEDYNNNAKIDGPYDSWVDKNFNNKKDPDEEAAGDFRLLKDMGANAIRVYHYENNKHKELYRRLYEDYGIMVLMGDFLGAYAVGSGASWQDGTDYADPGQQKKMTENVKKMVEEYKDEPYVLMWVLGNETNYGVANSARKDPVSYYKFVNETAKMIKSIDPTRPVAISNGDVLYLDIFAEHCPDVDIYGSNSYRGEQGFGMGFWHSAKKMCDKPVLITEYGCPAYQKGRTREIAEVDQAKYHEGAWEDILYNSAGCGAGNAIGGVVFEWLDEWWKAYEPSLHDTEALYSGPFPGGWVYEEWFGIAGQGDGSASPYLRQLRESYYMYKKMWNQ